MNAAKGNPPRSDAWEEDSSMYLPPLLAMCQMRLADTKGLVSSDLGHVREFCPSHGSCKLGECDKLDGAAR
jgi:hypothetical protein